MGEMTNQADALVAEAVGYEAWQNYKDRWCKKKVKYRILQHPSDALRRSLESLRADGYKRVSLVEWASVEGLPNYLKPIPFISDPTYETDGIVKVWLKENNKICEQIEEKLKRIWMDRANVDVDKWTNWDTLNWLLVMLDQEESGDYAKALLATLEEERDG